MDLNAEREWVASISRKAPAQPLLRHFAALDAIVKGNLKAPEPPSQQASVWRRLFVNAYSKSNAPFGMKSPTGGMPKCFAICNLSGQYVIYHTDSFSLSRIVCLTPQVRDEKIIAGVEAVITKAEELGASILVTFVLPFASTMDRAYWEVRTIRKTAKGYIKDGEMAFSITDNSARTTACTASLEVWPPEMLNDLEKRLLTVAQPACLDASDDVGANKTPEKLEQMVQLLSSERRKLIEDHGRELKALKEVHQFKVKELEEAAKQFDQDADIRIAEVIKSTEHAKELSDRNVELLQENKKLLTSQLSTQSLAAANAKSDLNAQALKHEDEIKTLNNKMRGLQAQISSLATEKSRSEARDKRAREEAAKNHADEKLGLQKIIDEKVSEIKKMETGIAAVNTSSKEANKAKVAAERNAKMFSKQLDTERRRARIMLAILHLASVRVASKSENPEDDITEKDTQINSMQGELDKKTEDIALLTEKCNEFQTELGGLKEQAKKEAESQKSTQEQMSRELAVLKKKPAETESKVAVREDPKLKDALRECARLRQRVSEMETTQQISSPREGTAVTNTVNVQNSMFVPAHYHPHSAFPQGNGTFPVDTGLESTISQLHIALNTLTAAARASGGHRKALEASNAKLELYDQWYGSMQGYPGYQHHQQNGYNQNGY